MYIYQQKKKKTDYETISSYLSVVIIFLLLLFVLFFLNSTAINKKTYLEKESVRKIGVAMIKRKPEMMESAVKKLPDLSPREKRDPDIDEALLEEVDFSEEQAVESESNDMPADYVSQDTQISSISEQDKLITKLVSLINSKKRYPASARRRNISGSVEIVVYIDEKTKVAGFEIASADNPILKASAEKVMRQLVNVRLGTAIDKRISVKIPVKYVLN